MLDVFKNDAFGVVPLTNTINKLKYVPGQISKLGLFSTTSVATTSIAIEEKSGVLTLVAPTPRGGPGVTLDKSKRNLRSIAIPHFEINDAIMAEEVQGVRAWGSETEVEMVQGKVAERMAIHVDSHAATTEYSRVGAIKGVVTYADGSTLDLFALFGVTQQAEVDFDLDNPTPTSGALRKKCAAVVRMITEALDGVPLQGVRAICSKEFFDDLVAHPEVRDTYLGWVQAEELRNGYAYGAFPFGGIMWEEYRGSVGGTAFVAADKAHIFPVAAGLFQTVYAPADYVETVNTLGQPMYAKQYMMANGKGVHFDTQTNQVHFCTRPNTLIQARRT